MKSASAFDSTPQAHPKARDEAAWVQGKERYERQVNYVLAVLRRHPHFIDMLNGEDKEQFLSYFKPDWTQVGTFVQYHDQILHDDPNAENSALWLLARFCTLNELVLPENLLAGSP